MRPPASPSCRLYEPEARGAYAYAPAGRREKDRKPNVITFFIKSFLKKAH